MNSVLMRRVVLTTDWRLKFIRETLEINEIETHLENLLNIPILVVRTTMRTDTEERVGGVFKPPRRCM